MRNLPHDLAHRLAAEYALGTLRGRARARFEALARADAEVDKIRRAWEGAFGSLSERVAGIEPPARVWKRIEERIAGPAPRGVWSSLAFWRSFGLVAGGLASVLVAAFLYISAAAPLAQPVFVAVLVSPSNEARMTLTMLGPDTLRIHNVRPWPSVTKAGRTLELWALPKEGAPRSLGEVANEPGDFVVRIGADDPRVQGVVSFALSSEPPGGSPTKQPSGPVLCAGPAGRARKA